MEGILKTHSSPLYYDTFRLLCKHLDIQTIICFRRVCKGWLAWVARYIKENPIDLSFLNVTNDGLKAFAGVRHINLSRCFRITDEGLQHLTGVQSIDLAWCGQITNMGLQHLAGVQYICLGGCNLITNEGLKHIAGVRRIRLWGCFRVPSAGLKCLGDGAEIIK
jgi:hypothetical protein